MIPFRAKVIPTGRSVLVIDFAPTEAGYAPKFICVDKDTNRMSFHGIYDLEMPVAELARLEDFANKREMA